MAICRRRDARWTTVAGRRTPSTATSKPDVRFPLVSLPVFISTAAASTAGASPLANFVYDRQGVAARELTGAAVLLTTGHSLC